MQTELAGKVALVTGGSRGIGKAIALALAEAGADVALNYQNNDRMAEEVCGEIRNRGRRALAVKGDVAVAAEVTRMVEEVRQGLGPIGILVNNAGIGHIASIDTISEQEWDATLAVNLKGAFLVTQAVLPDLRRARWGRIINISSVAAQMGGVVGPHYAASKAGIIGLTHYYAAYLAKEGITVNAIAPGPIATDMSAALPQLKPESLPVGRFGTPEEIAAVALLLAGNGFLTGQTVNVNGGRYLG
ncbi:3-oxoacyl-ACP reductase family protein [Geomesophilobacter sediminis]|uniref:3-oxoacyl-ACP reductase FabG n=1 Tax=Geomesophilobacter sediminis TaxID=2798584 RepID=A0A8J7JE32_9BACT|nr:3-oxoacyl-ACP reductase family protein [Geomesophilobacter sediminis]MBJ6725541.1 3-oxoacyl-ACP reductase FabG [Geomesophilobacter sediminis]